MKRSCSEVQIPMAHENFSEERFDELIERAIDTLPAKFRDALDNLIIERQEHPDEHTRQLMGLGPNDLLLGLYAGIPLTQRHVDAPPPLPDRIILYRQQILAACRTEAEFVEQLRRTLLHEIGHYFGMDEEELAQAGY